MSSEEIPRWLMEISEHVYTNTLEADALSCLRKGKISTAISKLSEAISLSLGNGERSYANRLERARSWLPGYPGIAVCALTGHDYEGGATCFNCGKPI